MDYLDKSPRVNFANIPIRTFVNFRASSMFNLEDIHRITMASIHLDSSNHS